MVVGWSRGVGLQVVRAICAETWRVTRSWRPQLRVRLEYRGDADDEQLTLPDAAAPVDQVHTLYAATSLASRVMLLLLYSVVSAHENTASYFSTGLTRELLDTVKARKLAYYGHTMRKQGSWLEKEIMQGTMPGARRRGRPRTAWMDNIKTWTGLPVEESVRMTEDRDKW